MTETRRARFETLDYLGPEDLEFACEIWMDELVKAPWAPKEAQKLGAYLIRYIVAPDTTQLTLSALEAFVQLTKEDVRRSLALLQSFRAVTAFTMERDGLNVALRLSLLQQIRVLETRSRLEQLTSERGIELAAVAAQKPWTPQAIDGEPANETAPKAA